MSTAVRLTCLLCLSIGFLAVQGRDVYGQITVQQPAVGRFATSSSVSVPDRGSVLLGGVHSGAATRVTTGPWRSGTASGMAHQGSSARVSVFIHDLQAMDEALLAQGSVDSDDEFPTGARLAVRHAGPGSAMSPAKLHATVSDRATQAARFEMLARQAQARGKTSVSRLHWQMAARYGSVIAAEQLAQAQ